MQINIRDCVIELSLRPPCEQTNIFNQDNRETCDVVHEEVLTEVRNNLSQMKPELVSSIVDLVVRKVDSRYLRRIEQLKKRIFELENTIN